MQIKVMVVEDSRFFHQVIKRGLEERLGAEVISATSLAEARAILAERAHEILVALLDITLPDAPNGEVVDEVARHRIPSIVFTGNFSDEIREFVLSRHVVDYITKDGRANLESVFDLVRRISRNTANRILVVDDSKVSRRHIGELLHLHRFTVVEAASAAEAMAAFDADPEFSLAIVDYNMPETNGVELTRKLRARRGRHQLAIVGLSAYGNNVVSATFMKAGANDYLNKPFVPEEFFCRVYHNLDLIDHIAWVNQAHQEAARASDAKTRFLGHLNHEMCNPLNAVIGYAELGLGIEGLPPDLMRYLRNIHHGGLHMRELVSDALDMTRIEAGHLELDIGQVDLGRLCLEAAELLGPAIEEAGLRLDGSLGPGGPVIMGDHRRLRQVALNLISNAVKATPAGGSVAMAAGVAADGRPFFAITDSGCGMDAAGIATALAPFGQLGDAAARAKGTGLGLPLSKSLIEHHGGELEIDSQPGRGTRMRVVLPAGRLAPPAS